MAHFARVEDGIVREVIVVADSDCAGGHYPAAESAGQAYIAEIGLQGQWLQTSDDITYRVIYASGFTFDADLDEFVAPVAPEDETPTTP